ncbi:MULTISPECIES: hypothetical protein [unclassified Mesorhizobium]|uniref:hypothetical protein n=1 Tax=unclassified Mesorhizobium TaxID=325217 RepID=UPI0013E402DA|nr:MULTISPECIES: hypothetical protein [unclassified Mesorhizobium]
MTQAWKPVTAFLEVFGAAQFYLGLSPHLDGAAVTGGSLVLALGAAAIIATGEHRRKP